VLYEAKIINMLKGQPGFCKVLYAGSEGDFNIMVTELMGPSLEALHTFCERQFSVKTVC
jgi:hypothetical protein